MNTRLATKNDLPQLEKMFAKIVENLEKNNINIYWSEFYPYEEFKNDIENNNLYLIVDGDIIVSAFGVFDNLAGQDCFDWEDKNSKALYLARLGVNVDYLRQGIGALTLEKTKEIAKEKRADYLRLLVVDINTPAIKLYEKCGYKKVKGIFRDNIFDDVYITEIGYEIKI